MAGLSAVTHSDTGQDGQRQGSSGTSGADVRRALITGGTGYVGGSLIPRLLDEGWAVRSLSRSRERALQAPWADAVVPEGEVAGSGQVEIVEGDASDLDDVSSAMENVDVAWYLLHSMSKAGSLKAEETAMARTFAQAAQKAQISRIVYLGGLHPSDEELSEHLESRTAVGDVFLDSEVPAAVLQAGVVLGAGSSSYVMLRHLSQRLPGVVGPDWILNRITPISIRDVLFYLTRAADLPSEVNRRFDIGGPDTLPYAKMIQRYARVVGLPQRFVFTAPIATRSMAAVAVGALTPVNTQLATHLIGSLVNTTVVKERDLESLVGQPEGGLQTFDEAVRAAEDEGDSPPWSTVASKSFAWAVALGAADVLAESAAGGTRAIPAGAAVAAQVARGLTDALQTADRIDAGEVNAARNYGLLRLAAAGLRVAGSRGGSTGVAGLASQVSIGAAGAIEATVLRRLWSSSPVRATLALPGGLSVPLRSRR